MHTTHAVEKMKQDAVQNTFVFILTRESASQVQGKRAKTVGSDVRLYSILHLISRSKLV